MSVGQMVVPNTRGEGDPRGLVQKGERCVVTSTEQGVIHLSRMDGSKIFDGRGEALFAEGDFEIVSRAA